MNLKPWFALPKVDSRWRTESRRVMRNVAMALDASVPNLTHKELLKAIDDAYPFGERRLTPYKAWLRERRWFIELTSDQKLVGWSPPTPEDAAACEVASDMVELGMLVEAVALLKEQAPNCLSYKCPACGSPRGQLCRDPDLNLKTNHTKMFERIVPHMARVQPSSGPLFEPDPWWGSREKKEEKNPPFPVSPAWKDNR